MQATPNEEQMGQSRGISADDNRDLKDDLVRYYRDNESMIPVAPLVDEHKVPIEKLYVLPPMWAYDTPLNFSLGKNTQTREQMSDAQEKRETTVSQLFLSDKNFRYRKIYITAKAGCGKTSLSQKLTMTWCQAHLPLMSLTENYDDEELAAMKYFDFLFLLHLRDYQNNWLCNLDDLIMHMLSNNLSRNTLYTKEFLQRLLHEKTCLILLDGLDEWAHPDRCRRTPAVPHNNHPDSCTVLTTSKHWKLGTIGLSEHSIDLHIEISELDRRTRDKLKNNAVQIINQNNLNLAGKSIADFDEAVESVEIGGIIYNPYILLQLMCVFFGDFPIGKSKCEIYSNITEFTLERGLNKTDLPDIRVKSNENVPIPNCMNENATCKHYFILLMKLGKLAFYTLFSEKRESSLVFDRKIVTYYITEQEIEFCLKVGLLCQTKSSSIIAEKRYHVFFQHKSVQAFLSAIFITSEWHNESVKSTILNACSSLSNILEMENMFVFVCGLNPDVYTCISCELQKIVDLDDVTCRYRTNMYILYNDETRKIMKSYQSMQVQCFEESMRNGNDSCLIHLYDILLEDDRPRDDDSTALKTIVTSNKGNVKSLKLSLGYQKKDEFLTSLEPGVFTSLETLTVEYRDKEPVWLADILTESSGTLKCLTLSLGRLSLSDISITALTVLTCLKSFYLSAVNMTHSNLKCIYDYISKTSTLTQLKLTLIDCSNHRGQCRDCDVTLDLRCLNELKMLELDEVPCRELHSNPVCLEKLLFRQREENMSASDTLLQDLRAATVLSSLELGRLASCQEMIQTIPALTQLQFLRLADIDMGDLILDFSPAMSMLERVELHMVIMSSSAWRELLLSAGQLPRSITVQLSQITKSARDWRELLSVGTLPRVLTVELVMCKGPSDEEWRTIEDDIRSTSASLALVRTSINLPEEILRMNAADIEAYKKLLAEGEEKVYNIRVMIVGHFGVGKTVLTKRLLDQHQDVDISTRIPTEGIDVHVGKMTVNLSDEKWIQQSLDDDDKFLKRKGIVVSEQQITSGDGKPDSSKQKSNAQDDDDKFIKRKGQVASQQPIATIDDRSSFSEQKADSKRNTSPILQNELSHDGDTFANRKDTIYQQQITTTVYDRSDFSKQELRAKRKPSPKLENEYPHKQNEEIFQECDKSDGEEMESETNQQRDGNRSNQNDDSYCTEYSDENDIKKIDKMKIKRNEKSADLSLWDFAGQYSFYDTHQVFMSRRTIYLLVTDLTKEPSDVIQEDVCYVDSIGKKQWTVLEFLEFWLNAIHECSRTHKVSTDGKQESIDKDDIGPPVILVGTFADKLNDKNVAAADRLKYLEESLKKITASRLVGQHVIDNTSETGGFLELRKTIIDTARKQYYWGESKPARWIQAEIELHKQKIEGAKILKIDKLKTIVKKTIRDEEVDMFLKFHHECGNLIYFGEEETLKETIVLDPKWLIDAFKSLNPQRVFATTSHEILNRWLGFDKYGILPQSLINEIWGINIKEKSSSENSKQDTRNEKKEFSKYILVYLMKLGLLAEYESPDSKEEKKFYFAPSFIKETIPDQFLISAPNESTTSKLCFTTQSGFLPSAVFNKLLAFCIAKYSLEYDDTTSKYLLFCGCGKFRHELCTLFVYFRKNEIQVWLAYDPKKVDNQSVINVCKDVMTFVKESIKPIDVILHLKPPQTSVILTDDEFRLEPSLSTQVQTTVVTCKIKYSVVPLQLTKFWFDVSDLEKEKINATNSLVKKSENKKGFQSDCKYNGRLVKLAGDEKDAIVYGCGAETVFAVLRKIQALKIEGCPITLAIKSIGELKNPEKENYVRRKIKSSRFHHPFILPVYAIFKRNDRFYFVSPDCENGDLKSRLSRSCCSNQKCCSNAAAQKTQAQSCNHDAKKQCDCKLNVAQRFRIAFQVASAIHFLHMPCAYDPNRGSTKTFTVHGNITSNNIVLDRNLNARLIDFKNSYEIDVEMTETAAEQTLYESDDQIINHQNANQGANKGNMDIKHDYTMFAEVIFELMKGIFTVCI